MAFTYAGNLGGAGAPIIRKFLTSEDMYNGQLAQSGITESVDGHVQIADTAGQTHENDLFPFCMVSGIVDGSRTYVASSSGTAQYGDRTTYTTTQATIAATGASEVECTLIIPMVTLVRAPLFNAAWGTALTELTQTTEYTSGLTVTDTGNAITDIADDLGTMYCREGANRGIYRIRGTGTSTTVHTTVVPFPYTISVGDKFVIASCVLGLGGLDFPGTADCIDGNHAMTTYYDVYYHEINLEEKGKEYAVFSLWDHKTPVTYS